MDLFEGLWFDCEGGDEGVTSKEQCACEEECANYLVPFTTYSKENIDKFREGLLLNEDDEIRLLRSAHAKYLLGGLSELPSGFVSLDASRPWICYWILHALYLLDKEPTHLYPRMVETISAMRSRPLHLGEVMRWDRGGRVGPIGGKGGLGGQNRGKIGGLKGEGKEGVTGGINDDLKGEGKEGQHTGQREGLKDGLKEDPSSSWGSAYGGGPSQLAHGAPTYAAVLALCTVGSPSALLSIRRADIYIFFMRSKDPTGGFRIHKDGEVDSRATYTVLAVARILNILTPELSQGVGAYLLQCQSYEGGFGGEPGNEAHGGYNFCTLAGLLILGMADQCDIDAQEGWLLRRQVKLEGGFQGRTNKLVDSCYSFWQGAAMALVNIVRCGGRDTYDMDLHIAHTGGAKIEPVDTSASGSALSNSEIAPSPYPPVQTLTLDPSTADSNTNTNTNSKMSDKPPPADDVDSFCVECCDLESERIAEVQDLSGALPFNQKALQRYILHCGQQLEQGGLRDKPGKSRDYYHSCYALSGLSIAQSSNIPSHPLEDSGKNRIPQVYGDAGNLLRPTSSVFNIGLDKLQVALAYFNGFECDHGEILNTVYEY